MKQVWMAWKLEIYSWEDAPWSRDLENAVFGQFCPTFSYFFYSFPIFSVFRGSRVPLSAPINTGFKKELIGALFLLVGLDS